MRFYTTPVLAVLALAFSVSATMAAPNSDAVDLLPRTDAVDASSMDRRAPAPEPAPKRKHHKGSKHKGSHKPSAAKHSPSQQSKKHSAKPKASAPGAAPPAAAAHPANDFGFWGAGPGYNWKRTDRLHRVVKRA